MNRIVAVYALALLLSGCPFHSTHDNKGPLTITRIQIDAQSKHMDGSAEMITRCSGFILNEKLVHDFFTYAYPVQDDESSKYYEKLPCSSTGTISLNRRQYNWIIRAGGVGEATSSRDKRVFVCGKNCCDKVPGIC